MNDVGGGAPVLKVEMLIYKYSRKDRSVFDCGAGYPKFDPGSNPVCGCRNLPWLLILCYKFGGIVEAKCGPIHSFIYSFIYLFIF